MAQAITPGRYSLARLSTVELSVVHSFVLSARSRPTRFIAIAFSWLGNGWVYVMLAAASLAGAGLRAIPVIAVAALNIGLLHCLYPSLKRRVGRPRPYQRDPSLRPSLAALDRGSFPSGHAMTLAGALTPTVIAFPQTLAPAVILWLLMAWARLASAHHYPSDVIVGAGLGAMVSYPISACALAASRLAA